MTLLPASVSPLNARSRPSHGHQRVRLLDVDPDLGERLDAEQRQSARRRLEVDV